MWITGEYLGAHLHNPKERHCKNSIVEMDDGKSKGTVEIM
jgi:hypothetical protein